jgi:hypothetical protein
MLEKTSRREIEKKTEDIGHFFFCVDSSKTEAMLDDDDVACVAVAMQRSKEETCAAW